MSNYSIKGTVGRQYFSMVEQYVCTVCGFNMVEHYPSKCPFCGASQDKFLTADECSRRFSVRGTEVIPGVTQLLSVPRLGYEHAAYRIEAGSKTFWVDCPSCFDQSLEPVDTITFTHHHFLGASNLYRLHFKAGVQINIKDTGNEIASRFTFDHTLPGDFTDSGLEAFHVNGHTEGFAIYVFKEALFICDYVFVKPDSMKLNPYGPRLKTEKSAERILEIAENKKVTVVCGYNYVEEFTSWKNKYENMVIN